VDANVLADRSLDMGEVSAAVTNEGDKGGASDGLESDAAGNIYSTNYEHNAILRRSFDGHWDTIIHDPQLLWPNTLSLAADGYLYVTANNSTAKPVSTKGTTCVESLTCSFGYVSTLNLFC
jgi:sugar lactone lactonase YvrE